MGHATLPTRWSFGLPVVRVLTVVMLAVVLAAATITGVAVQAPLAYADDRPVKYVPTWVCWMSDEPIDIGDVVLVSGQLEIKLDRWMSCVKDTGSPGPTLFDLPWTVDLAARDPLLAQILSARSGHFVAVLCDTRGAALLSTAASGAAPSVTVARQACENPPITSRTGNNPGGPSVGWGPGEVGDLPSASSVHCSSAGAPNPYAQGAGSGSGKPRVTDDEIAWGFFYAWAGGTGVAYAATKTVAKPIWAAPVTGTGAVVALEAWGQKVAKPLGEQMEARYRDAADGLATQAEQFADAAEKAAVAAAAAAFVNPAAQADADKAAAAASAARAAANTARQAANDAANASTRAAAAAAHAAALAADKEAKRKADEAKAAAQSAEQKTGGTKQPAPSGTPAQTACEQLRSQLWECEQNGWSSFSCQDLARRLQGCRVDMTVALVTEDQRVCSSPNLGADPEQAVLRACGSVVAMPLPGQDPCTYAVETDGSQVITSYSGCDPTKAIDGCATVTKTLPPSRNTFCLPPPKYAPPPPCIDPTQAGPPVIARTDGLPGAGILQAADGLVMTVASGGIVIIGASQYGEPWTFPGAR